jgi:hypothetical protein
MKREQFLRHLHPTDASNLKCPTDLPVVVPRSLAKRPQVYGPQADGRRWSWAIREIFLELFRVTLRLSTIGDSWSKNSVSFWLYFPLVATNFQSIH